MWNKSQKSTCASWLWKDIVTGPWNAGVSTSWLFFILFFTCKDYMALFLSFPVIIVFAEEKQNNNSCVCLIGCHQGWLSLIFSLLPRDSHFFNIVDFLIAIGKNNINNQPVHGALGLKLFLHCKNWMLGLPQVDFYFILHCIRQLLAL